MSHHTRTHTVLGAVLTAAVLTLTACSGTNDSDSTSSSGSTSQEETAQEKSESSAQPEGPDLDGIPDVVAEVNGEEVTRDEFVPVYEAQFQQAASQAQMGGAQPDEESLKKQTAEGLVETELLTQEADHRGISASDDDVDDALTGLAEQNQLASADELLAALEEQGTSEDLVRSQVKAQVVVERLIEDEVGSFRPTEAELRKIYDAAVQQQQEAAGAQGGQQQTIPSFAEVRPQLVKQAKSDEQGRTAQALVKQLRKDADITINV